MKYPVYPEMKDSGVDWLGEIPEHWEKVKLQHIKSKKEYSFVDGPFGSDLKNEEYKERGIPLIQLNNIKVGEHIIQNTNYISEEKAKELYKHNIYPGDIVMAKMADPVARAAIVKGDYEKYVIVADCVKFSPNRHVTDERFLVYTINCPYLRQEAEKVSSGTTRLRISLGEIKDLKIFLPPITEQKVIANFLDKETGRIDKLIEKKEQLIELLQEKRQALISHAVTKGLKPDVPMKDSGISWLGEIPEHWVSSKFRRYCFLNQGLQIKQDKRFAETGSNRYEYITIKSINSQSDENKEYIETPPKKVICTPDDVLLARTGATGEVITGYSGVFHNNFFRINYNQSNIDRNFLVYYIKNKYIKKYLQLVAGTTTIPDLNHGDFLDTPFLVPSLKEQQQIVEFLEKETIKIDTLIEKISKQISNLKEYRKALISNAVTGKIDVREVYQDE